MMSKFLSVTSLLYLELIYCRFLPLNSSGNIILVNRWIYVSNCKNLQNFYIINSSSKSEVTLMFLDLSFSNVSFLFSAVLEPIPYRTNLKRKLFIYGNIQCRWSVFVIEEIPITVSRQAPDKETRHWISLFLLTPRPALSYHQHRTLDCLFLIWNLNSAHLPSNPTTTGQEFFESKFLFVQHLSISDHKIQFVIEGNLDLDLDNIGKEMIRKQN